MKKAADLVLIIVFIVVSAFFALATLFVRDAGGRETLSAPPSLFGEDGSVNLRFTGDVSDYFGDNFAYRSELIDLNSRLVTGVLGDSPVEKIIYGRDGWLFFSETQDDYLGISPMTARETYAAARSLYLMQEYAVNAGARFLFAPAPNKNTLYGEFMPYEGASDDSNLSRLYAELERQSVDYVNLANALDSYQGTLGDGEYLYLRGDSHWNLLGAAVAADAINAALGRSNVADFAPKLLPGGASGTGDLFEMLRPASEQTEEDYEYPAGFTFEYKSPFRSPEDISIATANENGEGSLLMFRDSFGNTLYPFMAHSFASALFSRSNSYRLDFIARQQAVCVVIELVERNLRYLNLYAPVLPAPSRELSEEARPGDIEVELRIEEQLDMPGFVKLTGRIGEGSIDEQSPVYVYCAGTVFEATPAGDAPGGYPFTLYIPEGDAVGDYSVAVYFDGVLTRSGAINIV